MINFAKTNWPLFILFALAILTRFLFLAYPDQAVFDEVYFGKFVSAYFTGQYYFDIHPPLGKLMIAGLSSPFGFKGDFNLDTIGANYNSYYFFILRFLPAFFSVLFVVLIYFLALVLGLSRKAAFLTGFMVLFDNAILGQSKFILVDIFLLFFGFASLLFFFWAKKQNAPKTQFIFLLISALFAGLSFSVKWTGLSFLGIMLTILFFDFLNTFNFGGEADKTNLLYFRRYLLRLSIFMAIPFLAYALIFAIHFNLLKNSGPGSAFMSAQFQKTLIGNKLSETIQPMSFWQKFKELNVAMYKYNAGITASHPYSSRWYEWPFARKPIWFWNKYSENEKLDIYLISNPVVWWLASGAVFTGLMLIFFRKFRKKLSSLIYLLLFGYFLNLLPFMFVARATFLYHYFPSLVFGIIIFALLVDKFIFVKKQKIEKPYKLKKLEAKEKPCLTYDVKRLALGFLLLVVFSAFIIFSPLTYGLPVPPQIQPLYKLFLR